MLSREGNRTAVDVASGTLETAGLSCVPQPARGACRYRSSRSSGSSETHWFRCLTGGMMGFAMSDQFTVRLHVERVENGNYLATSQELPGLVAQGRTVQETVEIAQDVARRLLESYREHDDPIPEGLCRMGSSVDLDVAVSA